MLRFRAGHKGSGKRGGLAVAYKAKRTGRRATCPPPARSWTAEHRRRSNFNPRCPFSASFEVEADRLRTGRRVVLMRVAPEKAHPEASLIVFPSVSASVAKKCELAQFFG